MTVNQAASAKAILWFATYIKCVDAGEQEAALYALERHHKLLAWLAARNDSRAAQLEAVSAKLAAACQSVLHHISSHQVYDKDSKGVLERALAEYQKLQMKGADNES